MTAIVVIPLLSDTDNRRKFRFYMEHCLLLPDSGQPVQKQKVDKTNHLSPNLMFTLYQLLL